MNVRNGKILPRRFYLCGDVLQISRELLGKVLSTQTNGSLTSGIIVETEAYGGPDDRACHSYGNRRTSRTETMYLPGGHAYVYLCYGIHCLFNVVIGTEKLPAAVLIRAIEPKTGLEIMLRRRKMKKIHPRLTAGPGALTQAMGINLNHDRADLCDRRIWIEDHKIRIPDKDILASPRVGVHYAGEHSQLPWRFRLKTSEWTSPAR